MPAAAEVSTAIAAAVVDLRSMLVVLTLANVVYKPQLVLAAARALSRNGTRVSSE